MPAVVTITGFRDRVPSARTPASQQQLPSAAASSPLLLLSHTRHAQCSPHWISGPGDVPTIMSDMMKATSPSFPSASAGTGASTPATTSGSGTSATPVTNTTTTTAAAAAALPDRPLTAAETREAAVAAAIRDLRTKRKIEEEEREKMQVLVSNFSEEQLNRYEMFRRAAFPKAAVKRVRLLSHPIS